MVSAKLAALWGITAQSIGVPTGTSSLENALTRAVTLAMTLVGMLAVVFIIYGGLQYVLSAGNPQRAARARETILYAVIALAVAISALGIVTFVANGIK